MTPEEKQTICDSIFKYISGELCDWMDNAIFTKTSMENLGELYYNHILDEIENSDTQLLNAVIRTTKPRNVECKTQEDYYIALCKIMHFIYLPSEVWTDVEKQYDEIFIQKYSFVMQKYHTEISKIDRPAARRGGC